MDERIEIYRTIREEIFREHNQVNLRMTWFLVYQTILAGGAFLLIAYNQPNEILAIIIAVGLSLSFVVLLSIWAASCKIKNILRPKERLFLEKDFDPKDIHSISPGQHNSQSDLHDIEKQPPWWTGSTDRIDKFGKLFPFLSPIIIAALWIGLAWAIVSGRLDLPETRSSVVYTYALDELSMIDGAVDRSLVLLRYDEPRGIYILKIKEDLSGNVRKLEYRPASGLITLID